MKPVYASSGTEAASFLDIPVGARPAALGAAYTALANDAYATVWNPAGLGFLPGAEVAAQHLDYLSPSHDEFVSFVYPFTHNNQALGASIQYWTSGSISGTNDSGQPTGSFSSHYASYNLSYGRRLNDHFSLGMTGKVISAQIADVSASAYAGDFGAFYRPSDKLDLAATLTNVGSNLNFISQGDPLPMAFHVAANYTPISHWLFLGEGEYSRAGVASAHMGVEWQPMEMIALRTGYRTDTLKGLSPLAGLTTGVGLKVWGQELSYAWLPMGELGNTQYLSLLISFGGNNNDMIQQQDIKRHHSVKRNGQADTDDADSIQLMQLLSNTDAHTAQMPADKSIPKEGTR